MSEPPLAISLVGAKGACFPTVTQLRSLRRSVKQSQAGKNCSGKCEGRPRAWVHCCRVLSKVRKAGQSRAPPAVPTGSIFGRDSFFGLPVISWRGDLQHPSPQSAIRAWSALVLSVCHMNKTLAYPLHYKNLNQ